MPSRIHSSTRFDSDNAVAIQEIAAATGWSSNKVVNTLTRAGLIAVNDHADLLTMSDALFAIRHAIASSAESHAAEVASRPAKPTTSSTQRARKKKIRCKQARTLLRGKRALRLKQKTRRRA
jgi:hypothetical protein